MKPRRCDPSQQDGSTQREKITVCVSEIGTISDGGAEGVEGGEDEAEVGQSVPRADDVMTCASHT